MRLAFDDSSNYKGFALEYTFNVTPKYTDGHFSMEKHSSKILVDANLQRYVVVSTDNSDISGNLTKNDKNEILIMTSESIIPVDSVNLVVYMTDYSTVQYPLIDVRNKAAMLRIDEGNVDGNLDFLVE